MIEWPEIYDAFFSRLQKVRRLPSGNWEACCPGHEDQHPSLSITADEHCVAVKCHGPGCAAEEIVKAMGLEMTCLFAPSANGHVKKKWDKKFVCSYQYRDESGKVLYEKCRWEPKHFSQRRPKRDGDLPEKIDKQGMVWNLDGVRRVVYRLPEFIKHDRVILTEGERDSDAAWKLGIPATCNDGGAGKWSMEYGCDPELFRGKKVVVVADQDEPGLAHAETVAKSLFGVATAVKVVTMAMATGEVVKDFSAWVEAHPSMPQEALRKEFWLLVSATPEWSPPTRLSSFELAVRLELPTVKAVSSAPEGLAYILCRVEYLKAAVLAGKDVDRNLVRLAALCQRTGEKHAEKN